VLAALILLVAVAQAAPMPAPPPASPWAADVEIAIAATTPEAATSVREDLQDLLSRRGVAARYRSLEAIDRDEVLRPASEAPCALACVWIDLGVAKPARAFVYISATASAEVVIRSLPLPSGVDEVAREEVSHIVASSVEALQAGRPLPAATNAADVSLAKIPRAAPPPPEAPRAAWLAAGVGAGAAHEGASQAALPVASLSLVVASRNHRLAPALWLAAGAFSRDAAGDSVALRFHGGELAAMGAVGTGAGAAGPGRVVARLGFGPGLELREATATAMPTSTSDVTPDAARLDASFFLRAAARLEVALAGPVGLFVAAACDARVVSHRYTVQRDDGTTSALFQPDFLRPSIVVGLDARLGGEVAP
jgi:hypothetical protein